MSWVAHGAHVPREPFWFDTRVSEPREARARGSEVMPTLAYTCVAGLARHEEELGRRGEVLLDTPELHSVRSHRACMQDGTRR